MDSSTITFIATLIIAFIFLRWFISSDDEDEAQSQSLSSTTATTSQRDSQPRGEPERPSEVRYRRPVNDSMIEVVQQLAPTLTVGQIRLDLQRTGSVQETVDRFLSEGTLPFPPGEGPNAANTSPANNDAADTRNQTDNIKAENLLKKYGIEEPKSTDTAGASAVASGSEKAGWSDSAEDRASTLQQKKVDMILKARRRLESQLKNEQDLSALADK